jgi:hypothetical protein
MADNLTTFLCPLSRNLRALTSWNPKGLSRPVMGLLYWSLSRQDYVWDLCSSGMLRGVEWQFCTDVSGQVIGPIFKGRVVFLLGLGP